MASQERIWRLREITTGGLVGAQLFATKEYSWWLVLSPYSI